MARPAAPFRRVRKLLRSGSWGSSQSSGNVGLGILLGLIVWGITMLVLKVAER